MADARQQITDALVDQQLPSWRQGKKAKLTIHGFQALPAGMMGAIDPELMREYIKNHRATLVNSTPDLEHELRMTNRWSPAMRSWFQQTFSPLFGYPVEPSSPR